MGYADDRQRLVSWGSPGMFHVHEAATAWCVPGAGETSARLRIEFFLLTGRPRAQKVVPSTVSRGQSWTALESLLPQIVAHAHH